MGGRPVHLWPTIMRTCLGSLHVHLILFLLVPGRDGLPQKRHQVSSEGTWAGFSRPEVASAARKIVFGSKPISYSWLWRALRKISVWRWVHLNAISSIRELKWKPRRHLNIGRSSSSVLLIANNILFPLHKEQSQRIACICLVSAGLGLESGWKWSSPSPLQRDNTLQHLGGLFLLTGEPLQCGMMLERIKCQHSNSHEEYSSFTLKHWAMVKLCEGKDF